MRARHATVLLGTLAGSRATNVLSRSGCLCTSDQPCWPSAAVFSQLEAQLSQPLIYPVPTAYPCYPPSYPSGNCTEVITNFNDGNWRASRPGSMEMASLEEYTLRNGTIDACFLNTTITGRCDQGSVPVIGVDARSVADVQAAIKFAVEHSLKLVVKNTGHDYIGRSTAPGAFVVWTHNMKNITSDDTFVPQGAQCEETYEAVTLGAGVQWHEAYTAVTETGRMIVGGISPGGSLGAAGGWLAGGGHSFLSPSYGLGVDNALEISVVLSTGEYLITNEYQNSDLFWALRGGGGGTYGVVSSVTYRTYPIVPFQGWLFQANVTNSSVFPELVEGLLRYQTQFTDDGWGGYGGVTNQGVVFFYSAPNMTSDIATTTTQPWLNFVQSLVPHGVAHSSQTFPLTWAELIDQLQAHDEPGYKRYGLLTSRVLSRDTVANNISQVAQVLIDCSAGFNTIAGGKASQFSPDSAGLNPAWRNAVVEAECEVLWDENTSTTDIRGITKQLREWIRKLHDATPNDFVYVNEPSPFEIHPLKSFFGKHYEKLKRIKDKYDPHRFFVVRDGVGSKGWNTQLTCRK